MTSLVIYHQGRPVAVVPDRQAAETWINRHTPPGAEGITTEPGQ